MKLWASIRPYHLPLRMRSRCNKRGMQHGTQGKSIQHLILSDNVAKILVQGSATGFQP